MGIFVGMCEHPVYTVQSCAHYCGLAIFLSIPSQLDLQGFRVEIALH